MFRLAMCLATAKSGDSVDLWRPVVLIKLLAGVRKPRRASFQLHSAPSATPHSRTGLVSITPTFRWAPLWAASASPIPVRSPTWGGTAARATAAQGYQAIGRSVCGAVGAGGLHGFLARPSMHTLTSAAPMDDDASCRSLI